MSKFENVSWMIIVNPAAANGNVGQKWPQLQARLAAKIKIRDVAFTERRGQATILTISAVEKGVRHLIAVGGDGTNHEVVNGIMQQQEVPSSEIFYTLLPVGTGNDWIRTHGIPKPIDQWLDMLKKGHCIRQEIGLVEYQSEGQSQSRYFANVAGMAYDGYVVRYGELKRGWVRNRFFYLLLILRCLFQYRLTAGIIESDRLQVRDRFYTINIGICRFSGGGMQLVPQADPTDGRLALTYAGPVSKLGVLLNTWRFYNGSIGRHPKIETLQVQTVSVSAPPGEEPLLLEADGEFLGYSPAVFSIVENALTVIVPKKM